VQRISRAGWTSAAAVLTEDARVQMLADASTHIGQFGANGGFEAISAAEIRSIQTPTLILRGEHSPAIFRQICGVLSRLLPNNELREVPNASHLMHLDNAEAVNAEILRFLAEGLG
jgi:pimeloyl-ACP methyl ester carboxylesterase